MSSERCANNWRGVPLSEIQGSQSPWGAPEFPLVTPSRDHAVLYHLPSSGNLTGDRPPKPQVSREKWDHDHVRMPCSSQSLYPVEDNNGETNLKKRWEIIVYSLKKPIKNCDDLVNAILSYNTKFKNIWKFQALHQLFNEELEPEETEYFFNVTLPELVKLALSLPKLIQAPIPLLKQQMNRSVSLSQQQIACLLANAFFCTFPRRNTRKVSSEYGSYPFINFNTLYEHRNSDTTTEKLKCICHYFKRVCTKVPVGAVTFARRSIGPCSSPTSWGSASATLAALPVHVDSAGTIEDAHGLIQLDFANKYLGGGVLGQGCVQEEIRFVICPELMVSMLFVESMKPNEAVMIIGSERYSKYAGYGSSFRWTGDYQDKTPYDSSGRRRCAVLAIDALPCSPEIMFSIPTFDRELNKAWTGFSFYMDPQSEGMQYPGLATGNWGCGAFGGDPRLKFLIQLMASTRARRPMAYYTFGDVELRDDIVDMCNLLARHNVTVGQLYKHLESFSRTDVTKSNLYKFLHQNLKGVENVEKNPIQDEAMETTTAFDTTPPDLSAFLQVEFKEEFDESPDIFSQDDDFDLIEVKVDSQPPNIITQGGSAVAEGTDETDTSRKSEDQKGLLGSSLIEAMKKLDNENRDMRYSRSAGRKNLIRQTPDKNMTPGKNKRDPTEQLKKTVNKKITDYFRKNP